MKPPPTHFADGPDGKIAYQVVGEGPIDLLFAPGLRGGNIDVLWEHPPIERFFRRLASFSRLILCNPRGTGPSDPVPGGATLTFEEEAMDFRNVLDAIGSGRASIFATDAGGWAAILFAATFPERTNSLALINSFATIRRYPDYPWGFPSPVLDRFMDISITQWGEGKNLRVIAPELADDERFRDWYAKLERLTMNPSTISGFARQGFFKTDLRSILPSINAPTLVISHEGMPWVRLGHGRYLAGHIKDARYVERPGFWGLAWLHDVQGTIDEVQSFLTGTRAAPELDDRVLATVLFTDIVGSTRRAAEVGDRQWRELMDQHDSLMQREIERFRGRQVKTTGDGLLATFDGPARAIRCALALRETAESIGVEIYAGLHTGEVEVRVEDVSGIAVNIAARVMGEALSGEVFVSSSVPPLVAGSDIEFEDRGVRDLKGVPGEWRLFSVKR
jgi:class 3 adenylate cyclase/pimeloyl-ACP methyl ester carboxylesterase